MKKMKLTIIAIVAIIITSILCSFNSIANPNEQKIIENSEEESIITAVEIYSLTGETIYVENQELLNYLENGWYISPPMKIYSLDNREIIIYQSEFEEYNQLGWYSKPVIKIYSINKEAIIYQDELETYKKLGWSTEPIKIKIKEPPKIQEESSVPQPSEQMAPPSSAPVSNSPSEDAILLAKVIYAEAAANITDRQYVGAVVMNRVRSPHFSNTIRGVIYAPNQYSCVGGKAFNQTPPQECIDIATQLLNGETFGVPSNVVFQAQFRQGSGVWKQVGVHYYCYI